MRLPVALLHQASSKPAGQPYWLPWPSDEASKGAELGVADNNTTGQFTGQHYQLQVFTAATDEQLLQQFAQHVAGQYSVLLLDVSANVLRTVKNQLKSKPMLVFDVRSQQNALRKANCDARILYMQPSYAMQADTLGQFLLKKSWRRWLLIQGSSSEDVLYANALKRMAKRFGMTIVAEKTWQHAPEIRRTAQAVMPGFTQTDDDYDVIVVADTENAFGDYVAYRSWSPRPVVGTHGLVPTGWHFTHESWGAVQLQNRFKDFSGRVMTPVDYAAYLAVRAVGEAATRTQTFQVKTLRDYLLSEDFALQGYKGRRLSFRPWSGQLRQPVLLATARGIVDVAPLDGFLHPATELDTLGLSVSETECNK
ncbi:MAG: ABC transporter substrate-binding protein [Methylococcales bacterium]|nr:ABC transporter substrate-binding protein [Methylococcales bacterium]